MTAECGIETPIQIAWLDRREELRAIYDDWRSLVDRTGSDIYLGPDWFDVWWDHFGSQRSLACLTAYRAGTLIGVVPFCIETIRIGPLRYRLARLAGTDLHTILLHLPLEPLWASQVLTRGLGDLLLGGKCDLISFTPASEMSDLIAHVREACSYAPVLNLMDIDGGSHTIFQLPETFDLFLKKLSKKRRAQFRRDVRSLVERTGMTSEVIYPDAATFRDFACFHNRQWRAVGKGGHFSDWPGSEAFYSALAERVVKWRNIQLHTLNGKDSSLLATQFALVSGTTCHWRLPARSLDPEAERFGLGKIGLLMMIEQLIDQGVTKVEGGLGEYDYKRTWGGEDVPTRKFVIRYSLPHWKLRLLFTWADLLNLLYYRIWFQKLAPRLCRLTGAKSGPLWQGWIRTRL